MLPRCCTSDGPRCAAAWIYVVTVLPLGGGAGSRPTTARVPAGVLLLAVSFTAQRRSPRVVRGLLPGWASDGDRPVGRSSKDDPRPCAMASASNVQATLYKVALPNRQQSARQPARLRYILPLTPRLLRTLREKRRYVRTPFL